MVVSTQSLEIYLKRAIRKCFEKSNMDLKINSLDVAIYIKTPMKDDKKDKYLISYEVKMEANRIVSHKEVSASLDGKIKVKYDDTHSKIFKKLGKKIIGDVCSEYEYTGKSFSFKKTFKKFHKKFAKKYLEER